MDTEALPLATEMLLGSVNLLISVVLYVKRVNFMVCKLHLKKAGKI